MTVFHEHHIIPKHAGGADIPENRVRLTIEEHAEAHRKRYEELGDEYDRIAWHMLSGQIKVAEAIKAAQRESGKRTKGRRWADNGKAHSEEFKQFMSEIQKVNMIGNKNALGHVVTKSARKRIAKSLLGNTNKLGKTGYKLSEETKQRMSIARAGDNNPAKRPEVREKIRQAALRREALKRKQKPQD